MLICRRATTPYQFQDHSPHITLTVFHIPQRRCFHGQCKSNLKLYYTYLNTNHGNPSAAQSFWC